MKQDNAFTGLEAAIVLIAFVVVAAVFSYVMLGAGFFATQKAQEVTYAGIQQATSNMYLVGQVYGQMAAGTGSASKYLKVLNLKLGVPEGGQPQDVAELQLLFSNEKALPTTLTNNGVVTTPPTCTDCWYITSAESKIYPGDKADIEVILDEAQNVGIGKDASGTDRNRSFTLEIKPRIGASYLLAKTLSTGFDHGPLY